MEETLDNSYLECGLPEWLSDSIQAYLNNKNTSLWDCYFCELQSDINVAEVEQYITSAQAWHLREKYLGIKKESKEECQEEQDIPYDC